MLHGALVRGRSSAPDSAMLDWEDPPVGAFLCCSPLGRPGTEVEGGHRRASMRLQRRMLTEVRVGRRSRGEDRRFLNGAVRGRGAEQGQAAGVAVPVLLSGVETRSPSAHALHGSSIKSSLAQTTDFSVAWIAALFLFELPSSETNARRTHAHRSRAHRHPAHPPAPPRRARPTPGREKGEFSTVAGRPTCNDETRQLTGWLYETACCEGRYSSSASRRRWRRCSQRCRSRTEGSHDNRHVWPRRASRDRSPSRW